MPAYHSNTTRVITILIHSDKTRFQNIFVTLLRRVAKDVTSSLLHSINAMILMPQFFDVTANEYARYKRNELELRFASLNFVACCFSSAEDIKSSFHEKMR